MLAPFTFACLLLAPMLVQEPLTTAEDAALAEPADTAVLIQPIWFVGDRYRLELVKGRKRVRDGVVLLDGESRTEIDVEVVGEDDLGFSIVWRFGSPEMPDDLPTAAAEVVEQLTSLMQGFELRVHTDEYGSFAAIENEAEVAALIDDALASMLTMFEASSEGAELHAGVRAFVDSLRDSGALLQGMAGDLAPYYMASGLALELGEVLEYEDELPNLFGGPNFPASASWLVESYDPEARLATVRWRQEIDAERAAPVWRATSKLMAEQSGSTKPLSADDHVPTLQITDDAVFVYDLEYGLPIEARVTRSVINDEGGSQVDVRSYRLLEYPDDPAVEAFPDEDSSADEPQDG